ncbi:nuclear transport factor 2 family protein [Aestuariivivens sediminis]|uniref:nuclear transport factor 2 family protein n=1 Tax=Aestuariivivens sediminis TaxID=2913557 RepID=UPI001F5A0216|nr:nuclear transport factor 2 family protein [Aestuariivivens sediminis]
MKTYSFLFLVLIINLLGYSQDPEPTDEQGVIKVIHQFFDSLETKDSLLRRQTTLDESLIWRRYSDENPVRIDSRFSKDDIPTMHALPDVKEIPKDVDIHVHNGIAVAWVPYEFWIDKKFSHCGVDVFTLFKMDGDWKIISTAYTVEKINCDRLKP